MFDEELCQPVLLLDTFFQFSQEKTKRREGEGKEATSFRHQSLPKPCTMLPLRSDAGEGWEGPGFLG